MIRIMLAIFSKEAQSQEPPFTTDTPIMLGLDGPEFRTFGRVINKEKSKAYLQVVLALPFNINSEWQVGIIALFFKTSPNGMISNSGFGDMKVFTKNRLF